MEVEKYARETKKFGYLVVLMLMPLCASILSLSDVSKNPRRSVGTDFFRIDNVTESDTQVIQCNASNTHGYLFANVFISVLGSIPCHWIRLTKRATMQSNENAQ